MQTKTLQLRIKDKHSAWLRASAKEVNQVFNFCNEVSAKACNPYSGKAKWLSGYDLQKLTTGLSKCDDWKTGIAVKLSNRGIPLLKSNYSIMF